MSISPLALVDCNNFFVSCERLFRPDLARTPVIVLSSNDGCVVSRSNEAKELGIAMGEPYFRVRELCERRHVAVFSSNFDLYRDISRRVMHTLTRFTDTLEVYSIDEAFLEFPQDRTLAGTHAATVKDAVLREVGIPVSVGVAPTKTLAKVAAHLAKLVSAKKLPNVCLSQRACGVLVEGIGILFENEVVVSALRATPVDEVWGVGFRLAPMLRGRGVLTAYDLASQDDRWVKQRMSVRGLRTVYELRGTLCYSVGESGEQRKSLLHSQSFGRSVETYSELSGAVATHARKVAEVLRAEGVAGRQIGVLIRTSRHRADKRYAACTADMLDVHTSDTFTIVGAALSILRRIYRPGYPYAKAGVLVSDIVAQGAVPGRTLFGSNVCEREPLMRTLDTLRHRFGDSVRLGVETGTVWKARHELLSPRYTTSWDGLCKVDPMF